jgi:hypothetical protein
MRQGGSDGHWNVSEWDWVVASNENDSVVSNGESYIRILKRHNESESVYDFNFEFFN